MATIYLQRDRHKIGYSVEVEIIIFLPVTCPDVSVECVVEVDGLAVGGGGQAAGLRGSRVHLGVPAIVVHALALLHQEAGLEIWRENKVWKIYFFTDFFLLDGYLSAFLFRQCLVGQYFEGIAPGWFGNRPESRTSSTDCPRRKSVSNIHRERSDILRIITKDIFECHFYYVGRFEISKFAHPLWKSPCQSPRNIHTWPGRGWEVGRNDLEGSAKT